VLPYHLPRCLQLLLPQPQSALHLVEYLSASRVHDPEKLRVAVLDRRAGLAQRCRNEPVCVEEMCIATSLCSVSTIPSWSSLPTTMSSVPGMMSWDADTISNKGRSPVAGVSSDDHRTCAVDEDGWPHEVPHAGLRRTTQPQRQDLRAHHQHPNARRMGT
jgi:hypothetical protein